MYIYILSFQPTAGTVCYTRGPSSLNSSHSSSHHATDQWEEPEVTQDSWWAVRQTTVSWYTIPQYISFSAYICGVHLQWVYTGFQHSAVPHHAFQVKYPFM